MLDWLRYFPWRLRFTAEPVCPKGPYFSKLRPITWHYGDNRIHLGAPWTNRAFDFYRDTQIPESTSPGRYDIANYYLHIYPDSLMPNQRWQRYHFFYREWYFVGPWFTGERATLRMLVDVVGPSEENSFCQANFFHPRVFETVVADFLNSYFGHKKYRRKPDYRGPLNWRVVSLSDTIQGVTFDIHKPQGNPDNPVSLTHLLFPISPNRFIRIYFDTIDRPINHPTVDMTPLLELTDNIINSFSLELGPQTLSQWQAVKEHCSDMSLTPEFGELKWPIKPEDVGKTQPIVNADNAQKIITGHSQAKLQ